MEVSIIVLLFLLGIFFIVKGGDWFVDAASWIAEISGIPKLIVGATIVSLATTLPEMLVSVIAAVNGKVDMATGNAMGSVTANIGLIMATAIFFMPVVIKRKEYLLKSILMIAAAIILYIFGRDGQVEFSSSIILLVIFIVAMIDNVKYAIDNVKEKHEHDLEEEKEDKKLLNKLKIKVGLKSERKSEEVKKYEARDNIIKFIAGAVGIVLGADLLTTNGSELARIIGISERIIAVTIISIGTSLPELVTTITAIVKKESALSIGNIVGANIIDLTLILPICVLITGGSLPVSNQVATIDMPACLLVAAIAMVPALVSKKFSKWQSVCLITTYITYIVVTTSAIV